MLSTKDIRWARSYLRCIATDDDYREVRARIEHCSRCGDADVLMMFARLVRGCGDLAAVNIMVACKAL